MKTSQQKRYFKIQTKITFGIVMFMLIFMGLISYLSYLTFIKFSKIDISKHLSSMVSIASLQIDGEMHKSLLVHDDENSANFKEIQNVLKNIRSSSNDIQNIYTMTENENKEIVFVVSDSGIDVSLLPHLGDVYTSSSTYLKNNFSNITRPVVESNFYTDQFGTWLSGYAPFYDNDNKKVGVLGIDIRASDIIEQNKKIFILYLITFLLAGLFASLVGLNISKRISKSISSLTNMLKDERNLEVFPSSNDEIGELKNAFETILDKTNESKVNIEEQLLGETRTIEKINKVLASKEVEIAELKKRINESKNNNLKKS